MNILYGSIFIICILWISILAIKQALETIEN